MLKCFIADKWLYEHKGMCTRIHSLCFFQWELLSHIYIVSKVKCQPSALSCTPIRSTSMGTELPGSLPNFSPNLSPTLQELTTQKTALLILIYCRCIFLYRVSLWLIIHIKCTCTLLTTLPFLMLTHSLLLLPYNVTFTTRFV